MGVVSVAVEAHCRFWARLSIQPPRFEIFRLLECQDPGPPIALAYGEN